MGFSSVRGLEDGEEDEADRRTEAWARKRDGRFGRRRLREKRNRRGALLVDVMMVWVLAEWNPSCNCL